MIQNGKNEENPKRSRLLKKNAEKSLTEEDLSFVQIESNPDEQMQ